MATNIRIVHAHDFLRATAEGRLDLEVSKKLLAEIALATVTVPDYELMLDTRKAQIEMSVTDLWYLVTDTWYLSKKPVSAPGPFPRKTAVLCPLEEFDRASFFALCAQNRGLHVRAFNSFEVAIEWLMADET